MPWGAWGGPSDASKRRPVYGGRPSAGTSRPLGSRFDPLVGAGWMPIQKRPVARSPTLDRIQKRPVARSPTLDRIQKRPVTRPPTSSVHRHPAGVRWPAVARPSESTSSPPLPSAGTRSRSGRSWWTSTASTRVTRASAALCASSAAAVGARRTPRSSPHLASSRRWTTARGRWSGTQTQASTAGLGSSR